MRQGAINRLAERMAAILGGAIRGALGGAFVGFLGMLGSHRYHGFAPTAPEVAIPFMVGATLFFALLGGVHGARLEPRAARMFGALAGPVCVLPFGLHRGATLEVMMMGAAVAIAGALLAGLHAELS